MLVQGKKLTASSQEREAFALEKLSNALRDVDALFSKPRLEQRFMEGTFKDRKQLMLDLANVQQGEDGSKWFWKRWGKWTNEESFSSTDSLRTDLRAVWAEESITIRQLVLDSWLAWSPSDSPSKGGQGVNEIGGVTLACEQVKGVPGAELLPAIFTSRQANLQLKNFHRYSLVRCSLADRKLVFNRFTLRTILIQGVFEHLDHFKVCVNEDCLAPFYIAKRSDQLVCNAESCKAEKQREYARRWWNQNRAKKEKPVKTRIRKKGEPSGTSKAR